MCCVGISAKTVTATSGGSLARGATARVLMCVILGLPASGCALSFPIAGFTDDTATGSIAKPDALLFKALDQEDWRRAKAAMAVALDPQGNGASVAWDNPQSGAHGSFVAAAAPFPRQDAICRAFHAHVVPAPKSERDVSGSACRAPDGDWTVREAALKQVAAR